MENQAHDPSQPLPKPPENISIHASVERQWEGVLDLWKSGWHAESSIERLETYLEYHRERIFEKNEAEGAYDWQGDWAAARTYHDHQRDFVGNRRAHNDGLHIMWKEWHERSVGSLVQLSLEALRSMILVNGAAILACLTLLSGQVEKPNPSALLAAKIMLFSAILSMALMAAGHLMGSIRMLDMTSRVRGVLVGHVRHRRLYAISRYLVRNLDPVIEKANALIYASIFVFAFSAFVCAFIVIFDVGQ